MGIKCAGWWLEVWKMCKLFFESVRVPMASLNDGICEGTGEYNKKGNILERVMKYWIRLREIQKTNLLGDTLGQHNRNGGNDKKSKIE